MFEKISFNLIIEQLPIALSVLRNLTVKPDLNI